MDKRLEFHEILCELVNITEPNGDRHTYFDPPNSVLMRYPAIRYSRKPNGGVYANNSIYKHLTAYSVVVIDEDPESELLKKVRALPYCHHDTHYISDNLHHDVFTIYY